LGKLMIGESVREVIGCDLSLETRSLPDLKMAITHCENIKDYVSRELFVDILESEEEHIDWLQTQIRLIEQMGIENFVQLQTRPNQTGS
jgi:bacterioferritin